MDIFIGNLPAKEYQSDIANLLKDFAKGPQTQMNLAIQKHKDGYYCVANIGDDRKAKKFIRKYNLKSPYGHQLMVREFIHRSYGNERRDIGWRQKRWQGIEKRQFERRSFKVASEI